MMVRSLKFLAGVSVLAVTITGCAQMSVADKQSDEIAEGRQIAEVSCASCHGLDGESSHVDAPELKHVLANYSSDALADDLIEGIQLGHEDMPLFDFEVIGADALVAYLVSIQEN